MGEQHQMRAAASGDRESLAALLSAEGLPPMDPAEGSTHFQVIDDGQGVIATAGIESHGACALLRSVVVAPGQRGRGLARRLVEHMAALAGARGHDTLYLLTMDAQEYFAGLGFTPIARDEAPNEIRRCRQFREQCPGSAVLMRRPIVAGGTPS